MAELPQELEGTWEEILEHSEELAGRRVRLTLLGRNVVGEVEPRTVAERQKAMLAVLEELDRNPLPPEEVKILDDFEPFRKDHPIRFRRWDQ